MARPIATQETVFAAADALEAAGQDPSIIAVQERTGGSYSTVKRYLDVWRSARQTPAPAQLPSVLVERGQALLASLWQVAQDQAGQQVAQAQQEAQHMVSAVQGQLAEAEQAISRLEAQADSQLEQLDQAKAAIAQLEEQLAQARSAAQVAEARAGDLVRLLEEATAERKEAQERAHAAELAQATQRSELEAVRKQLQSAQDGTA